MTRIPFMDRAAGVQGFARGRWDDYADVPDGGLAETEAFEDALQVRKTATPDGLSVDFRCNDLMPHGYVVEWSELIAISNGMSPSDPRLRVNPEWAVSYDGGRAFANYIGAGSCNCKRPVAVEITRDEATKALLDFKHYVRNDAEAARVYATIQGMRQRREIP